MLPDESSTWTTQLHGTIYVIMVSLLDLCLQQRTNIGHLGMIQHHRGERELDEDTGGAGEFTTSTESFNGIYISLSIPDI